MATRPALLLSKQLEPSRPEPTSWQLPSLCHGWIDHYKVTPKIETLPSTRKGAIWKRTDGLRPPDTFQLLPDGVTSPLVSKLLTSWVGEGFG